MTRRSFGILALAVFVAGAFLVPALFPPSPTAVAQAAAARKGYVGVFKDNVVAVLDLDANRVLTTIPVPPGPHGLVVTADGRKAYVSSDGASVVSVIDTFTDTIVRSIEVGAAPHGLAISRDGRRVLVAGFGSNEALVIDTAADRVVTRVAVAQPHNSAFAADGRTAFVGSQAQGAPAIVVIDVEGGKEIGRIALAKSPRALDASADGRWLHVTLAGIDAVQVFDVATRQPTAQAVTGASPHISVIAPDSRSSVVVAQGPGALDVVSTATSALSADIKVGKTPHWVALSGDGRTAWVTNEGSNDVSVVDLAAGSVRATIPVGNAPRKIAVQTATVAAADIVKDVRGLTKLEIEADDYYFKPAVLVGRPGQKLKLTVENESNTLHNLTIAEQKIDINVPPKKEVTVNVTFPASGMIAFSCNLHAALGMRGRLDVATAR